MSKGVAVHSISLPDYRLEPSTDWLGIGRKLDALIASQFPGQRLAFRGVGLIDHPGWSLDELVRTIATIGTDRYDSERQGLYYARRNTWDIHAMPCVVTAQGLRAEKHMNSSPMAEFLSLFYEGALADRGYSVRIDVLMIYGLDQLEPIHDLPPEQCYEFAFKFPGDKVRALLGIIQIL